MKTLLVLALSVLGAPTTPTLPSKVERNTWPMTVELALKLYVASNPAGTCGVLETPERIDLCHRAVARQSLDAAEVMVQMLEQRRK